MTYEQTVEIPPDRRLFLDVPPEVPAGKTILTFTPVSDAEVRKDLEYAAGIWANNRTRPVELREKLQNLRGSLGQNSFGGLDGVSYQREVREVWDD